ncbi:MAG: putative amidohydrolase YtcJ [Saprospiraceae bacterium]
MDFLVGDDRTDNVVPLKKFYDAAARVVLSSDWDVSDLNPFVGMQNALTRAPQNLPNIEEAIRSYTINAAYVMRQEDIVGSLEVGKYADMIVLDKDITKIPAGSINTTQVVRTLLAGETIYSKWK